MRESRSEAELCRSTGHRRFPVAQTDLPALLACLCRLAGVSWTWISDLVEVLDAANSGIPSACFGGACVQSSESPRIWSLRARTGCYSHDYDGQICMGI